jgi:plastocyanin
VNKGISRFKLIFGVFPLLIVLTLAVRVNAIFLPPISSLMTFACYTVDIETINNSPKYSPDTVKIFSGDTVVWKNRLKESHSATGSDWDTGLIKTNKNSSPQVFYSTGTVQYHSKAKGSTLKGVIIVQTQSTNASFWEFFGMNDLYMKQDSYTMGDLQLDKEPVSQAFLPKDKPILILANCTPRPNYILNK